MVTSAPVHAQVVAIVPRNAPHWLHQLVQTCGFAIAPGTKSVLKRASLNELPDCIIGAPTVRVLSAFQSLREAMDLPQRPLLVLLSDSPDPVSVADCVWPPEPALVLHNLQAALWMRTRWLAAEAQHAQGVTASDYERLLALQQRTNHDLELLRTTIVSNVSHEMRTPLVHVKGAITLMGESDDAETRREYYDYAVEFVGRLEGIINNITMLAGALGDLRFTELYLPDALDEALRNLRRSWVHRANVDRVVVLRPPRLPLVVGDRRAIAIVLQLLIDNALKFSEDPVEVELTANETHVIVRVRDHGIGIAPDQHDRIFESFYQENGGSARKFQGLGVGLAIARQVVEAHGGRIIVQSQLNAGSDFLFGLAQCEP